MDISINKFDIIVGFFILTGLLALAVFTVFLAGPDLFEIGSVEVRTYLPSTYGLKKGVPVMFLETKAGTVKSVAFSDRENDNEKVEVVFTVKKDFQRFVTDQFHVALEQEQFGGILSGKIILNPPRKGAPLGNPLVDGQTVLPYIKSPSLLTGITDFGKKLQEEMLPEIQRFIEEINTFIGRINDPEGDFLKTLSSFRETADLLAKPDGELRRTLTLANNLAAELVDEDNLVMKILHDEELPRRLEETVANVTELSREGKGLALSARDLVDHQVERILNRTLEIQDQVTQLLEDTEKITSSLVKATSPLPDMMGDVQTQLREMEDITKAVKNIFIIRWNLEDDFMEDPVLLRPLILHGFEKTRSSDSKKDEE